MASDKPESSNNSQTEASDGAADVTAAVEELLNSISSRFASVSSEIFAKMDEMSRRLDSLEAAMTEKETNSNSKPQ